MIDKYAHLKDRIARRDLTVTLDDLREVAAQYPQDTAVILGKRVSSEGPQYGYELIILIVRSSKPITIMTRRESQNYTCANFGVKKIARI